MVIDPILTYAIQRKMGASVDWDKVYFTMDNERSAAVQNAFIKLYEDGLIYRDSRLVHWCCALETVISDIEVNYRFVYFFLSV
jgi:valyl-tRNA synthetase